MAMVQKNKEKKRFAFNSFTGLVQMGLTAVLMFFCIPVFINKLGSELWGVFSLVSIIGNLATLANLSLDTTLVKFLAEQGKCKESDQDIISMLVLLTIIMIPLFVLLFFLKEFILLNIFSISPIYLDQSSVLFTYLLIANLILLGGKSFTAILDARKKIYLNNFAMIVYSCMYWGGIVAVVLSGYGFAQIGLVILFASVFWLLLVMILALKEWGWLDLTGLRANMKKALKKLLKYSTKIYTGSLFGFLYEPFTKILISRFVGESAVGIFEIGIRIKNNLYTVFIRIIHPLYPVIAEMKDMERIKYLINKVTTAFIFVIVPIIIATIFCAKPFIYLWIGGDDVSLIALTIIVLVGSNLSFSLTVLPIYLFFRAKNHPENEIYIQALNSIVNIILIFLLHRYLGYYAVLISVSASLAFTFVLSLYYQKKYLGILPLAQFREKLKFVAFTFILLLSGYLFSFLLPENTITFIVLMLIVLGLVTILLLYVFKIVRKEDISLR